MDRSIYGTRLLRELGNGNGNGMVASTAAGSTRNMGHGQKETRWDGSSEWETGTEYIESNRIESNPCLGDELEMIELALDCLSFFLFSTELGMAMAMAMVAMAPVDRERDELCRQMNCFWSADVSTGNGIFSVFTVQHNLYIFFLNTHPLLYLLQNTMDPTRYTLLSY